MSYNLIEGRTMSNTESNYKERVLKALENKNDLEVQAIKDKHSIKTLNPLKRYKEKKIMFQEINDLLTKRDIAERKIKRKAKFQQIVNLTKDHFINYKHLYSIACVLLLVLSGTVFIMNKNKTTVKTISFVTKDEEKYIGDYINLDYIVEPGTAVYEKEEISIAFSNEDLFDYNKITNEYNCIKEGITNIKLFYKNKELDSKIINVKPILISKLYLSDIEIGKGNTLTIVPTIEPENATNKNYSISVDDNSVAITSGNKLTGVELGNTILHLKSEDGYSLDVKVNVIDIEPENITISGIGSELTIGTTITARVVFEPKEATLKDVKWYSSNNNIVSVDSQGLLTARNVGTATLTAYYNDSIADSIDLTVKYPLPSSVSIYSAYSIISVGNQIRLSTSFEPEKVQDESVYWSSSNEKIATVDEDGVVTGVSEGRVAISATLKNGNKDTIEFEVKEVKETISRSESSSEYTSIPSGGITYVLNIKKKIFHRPSCGYLPTANRSDTTASREEIISWGYDPCKRCHP